MGIFKNKTLDNQEKYDLNLKINNFIEWYTHTFVKGQYTSIGEYTQPNELRNFIEKMAIWYELRYPDYEITKEFPGCGQESKSTDSYPTNIKGLSTLVESSTNQEKEYLSTILKLIKWEDILSTEQFMNMLPAEEKWFLRKPRFTDKIYLEPERYQTETPCLFLSKDGIVTNTREIYQFTEKGYTKYDEPLIGKPLAEVKDILLRDKIFNEEELQKIDKEMKLIENKNLLASGILDCVMYRIIERGGNRIGPHRGFKFALEFDRDISIPIIYGIDFSDPGLRDFINKAIKKGLSTDLKCINSYFFRDSKNYHFELISIRNILKNFKDRYTEEEFDLHQKLVDLIQLKQNLQIDEETTNKDNPRTKIYRANYQRKYENNK